MVRILENKVELVKENLSYDEVLSKIEQATRLCYRSKRSETREQREKFLKNLMAVDHGSIIEHGSLSFLITTDRACANQIVRHRMASYCLSGDTVVYGDMTNRSVKKRTIEEIYNMDRQYLKSLYVRSANLKTKELINNRINNIYKTGKKEVYLVKTKLGYEIKSTLEHRFYTDNGWKKLKDIKVGDLVYTNGEPAYKNKEWLKQKYNIENLDQGEIGALCGVTNHTIRKWVRKFGLQKSNSEWNIGREPHNKGKTKENYAPLRETSKKMKGRCTNFVGYGSDNHAWKGKDVSISGAYARVLRNVDKKGICSICGKKGETEIHHIDKNPRNNNKDNLIELCIKCHNAEHNGAVVKVIRLDKIKSIEFAGIEETYDIEMQAPHHNFVANGFIVHNSQESSRYINLSDLEIVLDQSYTEEEKDSIKWVCEDLARVYEDLGGNKKSTRDKARAVLPQCTATRLYMTMNFRELRHFLKLRLDKAAHQSIREIAYQILKIMKEEYPVFVFDFDLEDYEDIYE